MKRGFVTVLPEGEMTRRRLALRALGLSERAINTLQKRAPQLCDAGIACKRIENLRKIGFTDPLLVVESQPFVLMRSEKVIADRIAFWRVWCSIIDPHVSIFDISQCRAQIFSAMTQKVHIIFLIAQYVQKEVTILRICNIVTLNIESVLIAFAKHSKADLLKLRHIAKTHICVPKNATWQEKALLIREIKQKLPSCIYAEYISLVIASHPKISMQTIIDLLQ